MFNQLKLRQQARIDYQQARGTAHKHLLQKISQNLRQQQAAHRRNIQTAQKEINQFQAVRDRKLRVALNNFLVRERLTEIPGIGEARKADILRYVYKGKLSDLKLANKVPGIGAQTQVAINQWVSYYRQNFNKMLQGNFTGKQKIRATYQSKITPEKHKIAAEEKEVEALQKNLDRIQEELTWLEDISAKDFYQALKEHGPNANDLDRYIQGVFAEWEQTPDWFRNLMEVTEIDWKPEDTGHSSKGMGGVLFGFPIVNRDKWRTRFILFAGILIFFGCGCLTFSILLPDSEEPALATRAPTAVATVEPSAAPTTQPSATPSVQITPTASPSPSATSTATSTSTTTPAPQIQVRVIITAANVRAEPDITADRVEIVRADDILPVLEINEDNTWYRIELPDGREGWIGSSVVILVSDDLESP